MSSTLDLDESSNYSTLFFFFFNLNFSLSLNNLQGIENEFLLL